MRTGAAAAVAGEFFFHQNTGPASVSDFQNQAASNDSRRRQDGFVPVVRFYDSSPGEDKNGVGHSGVLGGSWTFLDDIDPSITSTQYANRWGIPDGLSPGPRFVNDLRMMNIGYVDADQIENVFNRRPALPWPNPPDTMRRTGGGPELLLKNRTVGGFIVGQQQYPSEWIMGNWNAH